MSTPTAFVLSPVDAVDLVHRALMKLQAYPDDEIKACADSMLSQTVYQLRNRAVRFDPEQRDAYTKLLNYVSK